MVPVAIHTDTSKREEVHVATLRGLWFSLRESGLRGGLVEWEGRREQKRGESPGYKFQDENQ